MALMKIYTHPDPVLREKCTEIDQFDDELTTLVSNMVETMYASDGIGLAAPQVGVARRLIVLDVSSSEDRGRKVLALVNPEITMQEGELEWDEGCLSLPDINGIVTRAEKIRVDAKNLEGEELTLEAEGLLAVALQHEIDHLNGVLFTDHLSPLKRKLVLREYKKLQEESEPS